MMKSLKVIAVNQPHGTMTVMWDNDPDLEWNYTIPLGDDDAPLSGDSLLRFLVSESYENIKRIVDKRDEHVKRGMINFTGHNVLVRKQFNVEDMVREYEQVIEITG